MGIRDVIILGAGASKSEGAPLQKELFKSFFDYLRDNKLWTREDFAGEVRTIKKLFGVFWGIDIKDSRIGYEKFPTFEECLGVLDIALSRNQSFRTYDKQKIRNARNSLIFLIAKILDETLVGRGKLHRQLITRIKRNSDLKETAFISLNYDILIDNALVDLYEKYHVDYSIEFANYERKNDFRPPDPKRAVTLLKLHGSLNWLYCPTCTQIERKPKKATGAFYRPELCLKCSTPMEPIVVPPSFFKEMSNPFIQQILMKADQVLREARRIFICGYSFPDADLHVKYLLKRSEQFNGATPELLIIDPNTSDEFRDRFRRFFKNKDKVLFTGTGFEEFCRTPPTQRADYSR